MKTVTELIELEKQATPGPWKAATWYGEVAGGYAAVGPYHQAQPVGDEGDYEDDGPGGPVESRAMADAALLAALRNAAPHLLAIAAHEDITTRGHRCLKPPCTCPACQARAAGLFGEVGG